MKIVHICDGYKKVPRDGKMEIGSGSIEFIVSRLSKEATTLGHKVTILERRQSKKDLCLENIGGTRIVRIDKRRSTTSRIPVYDLFRVSLDCVFFAIQASKYLESNDFDVMHVHIPFSSFVLALRKKFRDRMIYTFNTGDVVNSEYPFWFRPLWKVVLLWWMKKLKVIVVLNATAKAELMRLGIRREAITLIAPGIDLERFKININDRKLRKKYGLCGKIVVLFVGDMIPRKGVEYLIKAASILGRKFHYADVAFVLVGNMKVNLKYSQSLVNLVKQLGVDDTIKFLGFVDSPDLEELFALCDIFVLPSMSEGFGLAVAEAMASGKPVIGTKVAGIKMQIVDGWNGFLVDSANEEQLADKMEYLIDYPEKRVRMGLNGRKCVEERFDWKAIAERHLQVYTNINAK